MKKRSAEESKKVIIDAARKVVSEQGVKKATLREIAGAAGISIGSLYYHYNSKDLILYDVMDQNTSESIKIAREIKDDNLSKEGRKQRADKLVSKIQERIEGIAENKIFFYLAQEAIMGDQELKQKFEEKYTAWINAIEDIIVNILSINKSPATKAAAIIINSTIDGFMLKKLLEIDSGVDQELQQLGAFLLRGEFTSVIKLLQEELQES